MKFWIHKNTLDNHKSTTGKAIYFTVTYGGFNTGNCREWFPMSQLKIGSDFNECGYTTLEIPEWILKQKGLLNYSGLRGSFEELDAFSIIDEMEI